MEELRRIIEDSEVMQEDDALWPPPDRVGRQASLIGTGKLVLQPGGGIQFSFRGLFWMRNDKKVGLSGSPVCFLCAT